MGHYNVFLVLCSLGLIFGAIYVSNHENGPRTKREKKVNTVIGYASLFMIYYGLASWALHTFIHSEPLQIRMLSNVACAAVPFILTPLCRRIYHGKSFRVHFGHQPPREPRRDEPRGTRADEPKGTRADEPKGTRAEHRLYDS
ncbi:hypothetical protein Tco_0716367, partial [Tanacetum coccineum]